MNLFRRDGHVTDEALLLLQDGELDTSERICAEAHLAECDDCCERHAALILSTEPAHATPLAESEAARDRLIAAMNEAAQGATLPWWRATLQPRTLLRFGAVAAVLLMAVTWREGYRPLQDRMAAFEETGPEPNRVLTPGAAKPVALAELCELNDDDLDPTVSPEKQRAVFHAYGMDENKAAHAYQVDYLINPQLGGDDDLENLWPEPYHATVWNAVAKDALETKLHGMVCSRQVTLVEAQHDLSTDWIAAYKKYFHAQRPVSSVAGLDASVSYPAAPL